MSPQPKKKAFPVKGVIGLLILILTVVGGGAAFFLSRTSQDIRQQASTGDYVCAPWTVTCNDGTTGTEASCSVQNLFGNDRNRWATEHCATRGGVQGSTPTVPGCTVIAQCRTYDCPNGMNYNGNECRLGSPSESRSDGNCSPPASGCGQIDYDSVADGGTDNYCGHQLFTDCPATPPGGDTTPPPNPDKITPSVACTGSDGKLGTFSWPHNSSVEKYILRIDKANECTDPNKPGQTMPWFCGTNEGFPNNTGDQYYLLNASEVCTNGTCSIAKSLVPNATYTNASIQWVLPGGSTNADATRMGFSPEFICATSTPLACASLTMNPAAPKYGETVSLTCTQVTGATNYIFQVTEPGQQQRTLSSSGNTASFQAVYTGSYQASCEVN